MRFTPQSASSRAYFGELRAVGGQRQLVERAGCEMARQRARTSVMMPRRTSGSPPVRRSLRTPRATKARAQPVELLERQQVGLRQERHVFRHAIDAAEVAAVGHRDAQIGDRAAERVDQRRRASQSPFRSRPCTRSTSTLSIGRRFHDFLSNPGEHRLLRRSPRPPFRAMLPAPYEPHRVLIHYRHIVNLCAR